MPISVDRNGGYGPPLVTDKYRPLEKIQFENADRATYSGLLIRRDQLLRDMGLWPRPLRLINRHWPGIVHGETAQGQRPPLVVVSSNRSGWIAGGVAAAQAQLYKLIPPPTTFLGPADLRALMDKKATQGSPIYTPIRLGPAPQRNVYVVVQAAEYSTYLAALETTGINVVGWEFGPRNQRKLNKKRQLAITGFGASRFAAIEFCKRLRTRATAARNGTAPWDFAWVLDDNIVGFSNFPGFEAIETAMVTAGTVAAGLHGGTRAKKFFEVRAWAKKLLDRNEPVIPDTAKTTGILQQATLWNIAYLDQEHLNFGKTYLSSAEDMSLASYLDLDVNQRPYSWYSGIKVVKEDPDKHDNLDGANLVNTWRQRITKMVADAEAMPAKGNRTALMIRPAKKEDRQPDAEQILGQFVINYVLPNTNKVAIREKRDDPGTQNTARSQAVEQLTSGAIANGFVSKTALDTTFSTADVPEIVEVTRS